MRGRKKETLGGIENHEGHQQKNLFLITSLSSLLSSLFSFSSARSVNETVFVHPRSAGCRPQQIFPFSVERKEKSDSVAQSLQSQLSYAVDEKTFANLLRYCADEAVYSSDKPRCLADTRSTILSDIDSWLTSDDVGDERVYWISGMAGMGNSTIAGTISEYCLAQGLVVVSFFFSRESSTRDKTDRLVPTIARQLMDSSEVLKHCICRALREDHGHFDRPADEQWRSLIQEPLEALQSMTKGSFAPPIVLVVIDALDECAEDVIKHVMTILDSLENVNSVRFKALLTSRRTDRILNQMRRLCSAKREYDLYRDVESDKINTDIRRSYRHRLVEIMTEYLKNHSHGTMMKMSQRN